MTIFDKISGFAQKAKDNALSRAVLAKDKRLDKSMSESIQAAHIGLLKVWNNPLDYPLFDNSILGSYRWPLMVSRVQCQQ